MTTNSSLRVTDLSFDGIRSALKTYLGSQTELLDYDFDSSTMAILLDILAYNTYIQSFYTNMVANEMFLDTAQLRDSVVSRAKMLGYTPRSARSSTANVSITLSPSGSPSAIVIPKNTKFTTTLDNVTYDFVTPQNYVVTPTDGVYQKNIFLKEGTPITHQWTYDSSANNNFIIPNGNTDTSSISVTVQESVSNTTTTNYIKATNLYEVNSSSKIFFVEEDSNGDWRLRFGDGVIGKALQNNNIVKATYRVCSGPDPNGASSFSAAETIDGISTSSITVTTNQSASGGALREGIESIRNSAPLNYETQNRAVTANDYERIMKREFSDVDKIAVWGGEDNDPPIYGKVYIAAKPKNAFVFSDTRKEEFKNELEKYNVMSIDTEFVDPTFLYLVPTITVAYNPDNTTLTAPAILALVQASITSYETNNLGTFKKNFYYSRFLDAIDSSEDSILGSTGKIEVEKRFTPLLNASSTYTINYNRSLKTVLPSHESHVGQHYITSSFFTYNNIEKCKFDDDGNGVLRIFYINSANKRIYLKTNSGTVDYKKGIIVIENFLPNAFSGNELSVKVEPASYDIKPVRNQILLISGSKINIYNDSTGVIEATGTVATQGTTESLYTQPFSVPTLY